MKSTVTTLGTLLCLCACGAEPAEFGPGRDVPASSRDLVWDAPLSERLSLPKMDRPKPPGATGGIKVTSTTPSGWKQVASTRQFRDAVFELAGEPKADCYLTVRVGGGVNGNLARWYQGQFGMAVPAPATLPKVPFAGRDGRLCELEGTFKGEADQAGLIAYFAEGQQVTSLKFTGPKALIERERDDFLALAASIRIDADGGGGAAPVAPPIQPGQQPPAGHPTTDAPPPAEPFTATTPDGWTKKTDSRRLLHHGFGAGAELYVSQLGSTVKQALDIWRGEMQVSGAQLGPLSQAEVDALPKAQFLGDDAVMMEVTGSYQGMTGASIPDAMMLVAVHQENNGITFCKLVGPRADVAAQRDAFLQFCGSVRRQP